VDDLLVYMRANGIRKMRFSDESVHDVPVVSVPTGALVAVTELELFDTTPPPLVDEFTSPDEVETKPEGICVAPGCGEKNGWRFAAQYCRAHGLGEAGVTGAR
jgi:hypothetical protein